MVLVHEGFGRGHHEDLLPALQHLGRHPEGYRRLPQTGGEDHQRVLAEAGPGYVGLVTAVLHLTGSDARSGNIVHARKSPRHYIMLRGGDG